jgi:hypothetical protein
MGCLKRFKNGPSGHLSYPKSSESEREKLLYKEFHKMVIFYVPIGLGFLMQAKFLIFEAQPTLAYGAVF